MGGGGGVSVAVFFFIVAPINCVGFVFDPGYVMYFFVSFLVLQLSCSGRELVDLFLLCSCLNVCFYLSPFWLAFSLVPWIDL